MLRGRICTSPHANIPADKSLFPRSAKSNCDRSKRHRESSSLCVRAGTKRVADTTAFSGRSALQNHRIPAWQRLAGTSVGHPVQPSCPSRVTYSRLHRTLSRRVWNISREGDSTASLGSLGQGFVTLRGKKFFLKSHQSQAQQKTTMFPGTSPPSLPPTRDPTLLRGIARYQLLSGRFGSSSPRLPG